MLLWQPQSTILPVPTSYRGRGLREESPDRPGQVGGVWSRHMSSLLQSQMFREQGVKLKWIGERMERYGDSKAHHSHHHKCICPSSPLLLPHITCFHPPPAPHHMPHPPPAPHHMTPPSSSPTSHVPTLPLSHITCPHPPPAPHHTSPPSPCSPSSLTTLPGHLTHRQLPPPHRMAAMWERAARNLSTHQHFLFTNSKKILLFPGLVGLWGCGLAWWVSWVLVSGCGGGLVVL